MRKLPISSAGYQLLQDGFAEWLDILGYSAGTIQSMPSIVREFLHYLEASGCNRIDQLKSEHVKGYHAMITWRTNERRGGGLSNNTIKKHIEALEKFMQYLHHRGAQNLPSIAIKPPKVRRRVATAVRALLRCHAQPVIVGHLDAAERSFHKRERLRETLSLQWRLRVSHLDDYTGAGFTH